jgi:hypothetical protein
MGKISMPVENKLYKEGLLVESFDAWGSSGGGGDGLNVLKNGMESHRFSSDSSCASSGS